MYMPGWCSVPLITVFRRSSVNHGARCICEVRNLLYEYGWQLAVIVVPELPARTARQHEVLQPDL